MAEAIINANNDAQTHDDCAGGSGTVTDVINLTVDVTLPNSTPLEIQKALTINGGGHTLSGPADLLELRSRTNTNFTVTINRLTVTNNNSATSDDGAIRVNVKASLVVNNSTFEKNKAVSNGAAINALGGGVNIEISNTTFEDNTGTGVGAAVYLGNTGYARISNGTFTNNSSAQHGGALYADTIGSLTISGSTFSGNSAGTAGVFGSGGALYTTGNFPATITDSVFKNNSALVEGGGAIENRADMSIYRSVFHGNSANVSGGAISSTRSLRLENSTIYNNMSVTHGGAVYGSSAIAPRTVTIRHVTFVDNESAGTGNIGNTIFFQSGSTAHLYNSIIVKKAGSQGNDWSGVNTNSNNIIYLRTTDTVDPLLGARSGGTRPYYPLRTGSPAINEAGSGACNALRNPVDQRGRRRPQGRACDIGAFEWYPRPSDSGGGGGGGGGRGGGSGDATPTPAPRPIGCVHCPELMAKGYGLSATYGLASGVQFRQVGRDGIGDPSVLDAGFMDAVDVYGYAEQGVEVCFPGAGSLALLDATTSPRTKVALDAYSQHGMTCAAFDRPGTVVLMSGPPAPAATQAPPHYQQLSGCMVTTNYIVNFRRTPGGALIHFVDPWGAQIAGWLPYNVTLTALERTNLAFKVDYHGTQGWIHADYVTPHGNCG